VYGILRITGSYDPGVKAVFRTMSLDGTKSMKESLQTIIGSDFYLNRFPRHGRAGSWKHTTVYRLPPHTLLSEYDPADRTGIDRFANAVQRVFGQFGPTYEVTFDFASIVVPIGAPVSARAVSRRQTSRSPSTSKASPRSWPSPWCRAAAT
jgi:hypothetical protein